MPPRENRSSSPSVGFKWSGVGLVVCGPRRTLSEERGGQPRSGTRHDNVLRRQVTAAGAFIAQVGTSILVLVGRSPTCASPSIRNKLECLGAKLQLRALRLSDYGGVCQGCRDPGYERSSSRERLSPGVRAALSLRSGAADCYRMSLHALPTACEQRPLRGPDGIWTRCGTVCVTVLSRSCVMWMLVGVSECLAADSTGPCARRGRGQVFSYVCSIGGPN